MMDASPKSGWVIAERRAGRLVALFTVQDEDEARVFVSALRQRGDDVVVTPASTRRDLTSHRG
jgi:hypothetical protein